MNLLKYQSLLSRNYFTENHDSPIVITVIIKSYVPCCTSFLTYRILKEKVQIFIKGSLFVYVN